jgi:hypothetical protein
MGTQIISFGSGLSHGVILGPSVQDHTYGIGASLRFSTLNLMEEFVLLLKDNPKVWAVAANGDQGGIDVWTYIDSTDRRDRLPVYDAEWELMKRYPDVAFDFNTLLVPAGGENLDAASLTYVYRR